jgi:hypothetical protein
MIGHNQPTYDAIVEENLIRGIYLSQRDALMSVARDPRCEQRHIRVLAEIIARMNTKTGQAYPGRASLARDTCVLPGGRIDESIGYTEAGVAKTISDLIRFGYIVHKKKAPENGGRALSHYTISRPPIEALQREIEEHIAQIRAREPRKFTVQLPSDVTSVGIVSNPPDVTSVDTDKPSDDTPACNVTDVGNVTHVVPADDTYVVPTVTSKRTSNKKGGSPADAGSQFTSDFETFWAAFPAGRKQGKGDAADLFQRIVTGKHKKLKASTLALIDGARRYAASKPDPDYVPLPSTWLNQGRWLDDTPAAVEMPWWQKPDQIALMTDKRWREGIDQFAREFWLVEKLGPPPGSVGCLVPPELVAELHLTERFTDRGIARPRYRKGTQ